MVVNGEVEFFVDASFAEDLFTRKSVSGYASHKNKGAITWGAKGQGKVALSSSDAELRALAECMRECNWLRKLMRETHDDPAVRSSERALPASKVFEDNRSVIKWVENPCAHSRVKHIDVPLKALRQSWTEDQEIDIIFIETHKQLGDALTKTLTPTKHWGLFKSLMNLPIPMQA